MLAKMWKQLDDWIMKMGYIYTMEYYSAIREVEILLSLTTWMDLENIILSKIIQIEKAKNHMISLICGM